MWSEFQEYLTYLEVDKAVAKRTLQSRRRSLEDFSSFCEANGVGGVSEVNRRIVSKYIDYLVAEGFAYSTIMQARFVSVGAAFRFLYREKKMEESVMKRVDKKAMKKKAREAMSAQERKDENEPPAHLSKEEVYELAENAGPPSDRNSLIIKLMFWTGIRASEAKLIEIDDIDLEAPSIEVYSPKTDTTRTVAYPAPEINPELRDWIRNGRLRYKDADTSDRLFLGTKGPITEHRINEVVRDAADAAGHQKEERTTKDGNVRSESTSHILRHSHAMHYLNEEGKSMEDISQHLGHSSLSTTEKFYAQTTSDRLIDEFS
ncbi:tyrosine-type recombinase/integrase [Halobacterium salinarum]|uniref:tyrosine-type recombinase/integrase n=1 Tax=Halobacterium salinarum TaxID=2242 RepID=UPI00255287F5|nr:tyrosine-type recombinase/integrase [Halobacterium salinarum]MDL0126508.1 tyrosine-type recombinase/integrase [Halobacterium salinarum]